MGELIPGKLSLYQIHKYIFTLSVSYNLNKTEIKYISKREI
jgi:hypothetical protein